MQTLDDHNFLVRSPFLDSMEISLSLESNHIPEDGIWCSHNFRKIYHCTKYANYEENKTKKTPGNLGCHSFVSEPRFINT